MTTQKHLKARIRERMQKTGESYTAARRHLAIDRTEHVPDLVPGYPQLSSHTQYDAGLWSRVLTQAGLTHPTAGAPFTEAFLAGLAGGIGFMVFTFEYQTTTTATVVTRFHPGPYRDNLLDRSGAMVDRTATTSTRVAQANLDAALGGDRAVAVRVTRAALPWFPDVPEFSDSVDVVVAGRDGDYYLVDDGSNDFHRIDPLTLAAARGRRRADKHWQASITGPGELTGDSLSAAVRAAVQETTAVLLGQDTLTGIPTTMRRNFGVEGLRTWAERLRDTRTRKGWPAMFATEERLRPALQQVKTFLAGSEWAGRGGLRPLYAGFLTEAADLPGLAVLRDHAARYTALGETWTGLVQLVDPACPVTARTSHFAALADHLDELARAEQDAAESLQAALG